MKRLFLSPLSLSLLFAFVVAGSACQKDAQNKDVSKPTDEQVSTLTNISTPYLVLNSALDALFTVALVGDDNPASGRRYGCANVTATPGGANNVYPKTVLIDFGTGCTLRGYHGKGSISFGLNQIVFIPGTEIEPDFHDFYINGYKIDGDYKVTTISPTEFKVDIIDGVVTAPDNTVYHLKGTQYYNQTAGATSPFLFSDDTYEITGSADVTTPTGDAELTVKTALVKEIACTNIVSGVLNIKAENLDADLDFGDGTCDNVGTITVGPFTVPVTLPF